MEIAHSLSFTPHSSIDSAITSSSSSSSSSAAPPCLSELDHGDFLAIDDLLDFSNEDIGGPIDSNHCPSNASDSGTESPELAKTADSAAPSLPDKQPLEQNPPNVFYSDQLCVPCDNLEELEWLSAFVEESFSSGDAPTNMALQGNNIPSQKGGGGGPKFQRTSPVSVLENSYMHPPRVSNSTLTTTTNFLRSASTAATTDVSVPGRARSKRCRSAVCFWNTRILSPEASGSIIQGGYHENSTTGIAFSRSYGQGTEDEDYEDDAAYEEDEEEEEGVDIEAKGSRKKVANVTGGYHYYMQKNWKASKANFCNGSKKGEMGKQAESNNGQATRKCLHCATQKTPQWRAGPMGPKTLCNACGVRYKSGRLCPEYRPAASPTFVETLHSNSHRKVLEMRRQKGAEDLPHGAHHRSIGTAAR